MNLIKTKFSKSSCESEPQNHLIPFYKKLLQEQKENQQRKIRLQKLIELKQGKIKYNPPLLSKNKKNSKHNSITCNSSLNMTSSYKNFPMSLSKRLISEYEFNHDEICLHPETVI